MASEIVLTHPFLRPGTSPVGLDERRRKTLWRTASWMLVALLHVLFFFAFVLGIRPFDFHNRPIVETILTLPMAGNNQRERQTVNPEPLVNTAPRMLAPPITIPKPPPILQERKENQPGAGQGPVDVLGAVGRELACSAGSWEHLTMVERQRCGIYPWRGMKLPNGTLVMVPTTQLPRLKEMPDTEFSVNSGADQVTAQMRSGIIPGQGGCPILQNTPCLHATPNMRSATGDR
ncbi:MAG TPA: hypothetical protein VH189_03170 [Rhizomicrobium sp.]|nr:hypothetical protein [Rhizomicrobium sp.]